MTISIPPLKPRSRLANQVTVALDTWTSTPNQAKILKLLNQISFARGQHHQARSTGLATTHAALASSHSPVGTARWVINQKNTLIRSGRDEFHILLLVLSTKTESIAAWARSNMIIMLQTFMYHWSYPSSDVKQAFGLVRDVSIDLTFCTITESCSSCYDQSNGSCLASLNLHKVPCSMWIHPNNLQNIGATYLY